MKIFKVKCPSECPYRYLSNIAIIQMARFVVVVMIFWMIAQARMLKKKRMDRIVNAPPNYKLAASRAKDWKSFLRPCTPKVSKEYNALFV